MARRKSNVEKIKRQYSLPTELVKQVQLEAVHVGCFDSSVIEKALKFYFAFKDKIKPAEEILKVI
ncbi:MAG: hypothetical protein ACRCZS_15905 [Chroococcidiopsis sp.]